MVTVTTVRTDLRRGINSGAAFKIPCKVATTAAITLEGLQTIDGIAVVEDDSVLVKNQADSTFNGIYWASSGAWTRRPDFDGYFDTRHGTLVWVNQGTTNALTLWRVATSDVSAAQGPLPGTTAITFTQVSLGGGTPTAVGFYARRTTDQTSSANITFGTEGWDSASAFDGTTYTVPTTGKWEFVSEVTVTNTGGEGTPVVVEVEINLGGTTTIAYAIDSVGDQRTFTLTTGKRTFTAGDTLVVKKSGGGSWSGSVSVTAVGHTPHFSGIYYGS